MNSREKFEAWAEKEHYCLAYADCGYVYSSTEFAWKSWQAASKASEQQLAAVVAENAGVKKFGETLFEMHNALSGSGTGIQGNYEVVCQQLGLEAAMDAFDEIKTPATDAAITNIQAQGVEMFAKNAEVAEQGNGLMKAIARRAIKFAAQLRQGAAL